MQHGKQRRWSLSAPCMFQNSSKGKIGCEYVGNDKYYKWLREVQVMWRCSGRKTGNGVCWPRANITEIPYVSEYDLVPLIGGKSQAS